MPGFRDRRGHGFPRLQKYAVVELGCVARLREAPRILHVTSDWKWTVPAAPMLQLPLAQRARGSTAIGCPRIRTAVRAAAAGARAGVEPPALERARGAIWWRDSQDARRLAGLLDQRPFDVVHTWHTRDHVIAVRATAEHRRSGATRLVRSHRSAEPIPRLPWNRWLFGRATDGLLCVSPRAAARNARLRGGRPVLGALGSVDPERFAPRPPDLALRASLGLAPEHCVVGITARVQRHRRFDLLLGAMARLARGGSGGAPAGDPGHSSGGDGPSSGGAARARAAR
jgi:hypothetical protein